MAGMHFDPRAKCRIAAGLFGIYLGVLGVHNFNLGFVGRGLAQLLLSVLSCGCLAIISLIWGLIEGILILSSSIDRDADGIRLRE
jgi:TM2 domain-containing membrane protein YozV